jgi:hypothetical protein
VIRDLSISLGDLASKGGQPRNNYTQADIYINGTATVSRLRILSAPFAEKKLFNIVYKGLYLAYRVKSHRFI